MLLIWPRIGLPAVPDAVDLAEKRFARRARRLSVVVELPLFTIWPDHVCPADMTCVMIPVLIFLYLRLRRVGR